MRLLTTIQRLSLAVVAAAGCCLTAGCFSDQTTDGDGPISEIVIAEGSVGTHYDIQKNEHLTIRPVVSQTSSGQPLTYTWEIDQKVVSTEPVLDYVGQRLGTFDCRLVVANDDGKAFATFRLNVNSPYEEGITIISHDSQGRSMLSFMQKQYDGVTEEHFEDSDCFATNNPDFAFAPNVTDITQNDGSLIVTCRGDDSTPPTIYYLNEKTLEVENIVTVPEYANFKPYRTMIPAVGGAGGYYPILCDDGRVFRISPLEATVMQSPLLKSTYAQSAVIWETGTSARTDIILWDKERRDLCLMHYGYGPFYCGDPYLLVADSLNDSNNYFRGYNFVFMFLPKSAEPDVVYDRNVMVITRNAVTYQKLKLDVAFWGYNELEGKAELATFGGMKMAGFACELDERTVHVASDYYKELYYAKGNAVKRWQYSFDTKYLNATDVLATVGSGQAVISAMDLSKDHRELYIAYYEPAESGQNGHLSVLDTETGQLLRQYDNIGYQPVKIIYKRK